MYGIVLNTPYKKVVDKSLLATPFAHFVDLVKIFISMALFLATIFKLNVFLP